MTQAAAWLLAALSLAVLVVAVWKIVQTRDRAQRARQHPAASPASAPHQVADIAPAYRASHVSSGADGATSALSSPVEPVPGGPSHAGARMGRYRLKQLISSTEACSVYRALDQDSQQSVAIKLFDGQSQARPTGATQAGTSPMQLRARHEARVATELEHPNIVKVIGQGQSSGQPYLVMEYLPWPTLQHYCEPGHRLEPSQVEPLLVQLLQALAHAHSRGVVHRDIKPDNILYHPETGKAKIIDFGVARTADGARTQTGVMLGTPSHMAPEQITGAAPDARTDLYALGVVAHQLLMGRLPYRHASGPALMDAILHEPVQMKPLSEADIPLALAQGVERALAKQPAARWQSALEWLAQLRESHSAMPGCSPDNIEGA
jgi:serine/threonine-protein kinase